MCMQPVPWPEPDPQVAAAIAAMYGARKTERPLAVLIRDRLGQWLADEEFAAAFGTRGKPGGKQRTDSTHVVAALAALNRLELAGESVRAALEALAAAHPDWVAQRICVADWARRYGTPMTSWRPPASQAKRDELAVSYARDGYALLEAVYDRAVPGWLRELPAIDVLRRVLLQNYTRIITADGREVIRRREKEPEGDGLPPGHARIASPYDTDARNGAKREQYWLGYKLHITETCDDAPSCSCRPAAAGGAAKGHGRDCAHLVFPNLITNVATTDATVTDNQMTSVIHDDLAARTLAPGRHYTDSGYLSAALVVSELARHGIALIGPLLADTSARARAGHGYARADFTIDYDTRTVTCPQGKTAATWTPCTQRGQAAIVATFAASDCGPCPARALCTKKPAPADLTAAPRPGRSPGCRPCRGEGDPIPRRLRPPCRCRRRHAPGRQPRRPPRPLPRPAQDPPRPPLHGLRPQPAPAARLLDRHPARPAAHQPPGTPRTQPRRIGPELTTRINVMPKTPERP